MTVDRRLRPEWTHLDEVIAEGVRWFAAENQPKRAVLDHHGVGTHVGGGLSVRFAPRAYHRPWGGKRRTNPRSAVIIFQLHSTVNTWVPGEDGEPIWTPADIVAEHTPAPFTQDEWTALLELVGTHVEVADHWNGPGFETGSMCTPEGVVSGSMQNVANNYMDGCPKPGHHVFCGQRAWGLHAKDPDMWSDADREFATCNWQDRFELVVPPSWPNVPLDEPAMPEQAISNRNLDQVLAAIKRAAPVVDRLGIHAGLVTPGRRGRVEDDEYVDEEGLGVNIPAEVYERLVQLASVVDELGLTEEVER